MKILQSLFLFAETIGFSIRLWWWQKFGKNGQIKKVQHTKIFDCKGRPTRYLHTIIFKKPDYVHRRITDDAWHYYRQLRNSRWVTIKSQTKLS